MTQYVLEIRDSDGWLEYCFEVTEDAPIPDPPAPGCTLVVMTNTTNYDEIVAAYDAYTTQLAFSYDEGAGTVSCSGPVVETWDIN
jgi:hypothetical protein